MKVRPLLAASLLIIAGCEAVNDDGPDGQDFTLGSSCLPFAPHPVKVDSAGLGKAGAADSAELRVLYVSADSLRFIVPVNLNCGLKYAFSASLPAPDTLVIAERVIGGSTARCMCRKELTVSLRAEAGQSLDQVKVLKTPDGLFADFH